MRIVLVTPRFPELSETFVVTKFVGLADRGVDVRVWADATSEATWEADDRLAGRDDLRARVWPPLDRGRPERRFGRLADAARSPSRGPAARAALAAARALGPRAAARRLVSAAAVNELRPDVVHFEFANAARRWAGALDVLSCPVTVSVRGFDVNYDGLDRAGWYDPVWRRVDAVHVLGQDLWRRAQGRGCPADLPHRFIRPAVDLDHFAAVDRRDGPVGTGEPLRLVSVSRLHWKKGLVDALHAVAALRARGLAVDYRIVGDGPDRAEIEAAAADLHLGGSVRFEGALDRHQVLDALHCADVFVHPAVSEGFANAVVEAQATGLAVVCTDADGLRENVADQVTGWVVPRRDHAALAGALAALAADGPRRKAMGRAARQRAEQRHGLGDHLDAWEAFYRDVTAARGQDRPDRRAASR